LKRHRNLFSSAIVAAALAFIFGAAPRAQASVTTTTDWTGTTSGNWDTSTNWSNGLPDFTTIVIIDSAGTQPVISNFNAFSDNITIGATANSTAATILSILSGGTLTGTTNGTIGGGSGSTGTVLISGANSRWNMGVLLVGDLGNGTLQLVNGGVANASLTDANGNAIILGNQTGSNGTVTVNDSQLLPGTGGIIVGENGTGNLAVSNGSNLTIATTNNAGYGMIVGDQAGAGGAVTISDTGTVANIAGALIVGNLGTGAFTVANGANVTITGEDSANVSLYLGNGTSSNGSLVVNGTNSILKVSGSGAFVIGNLGNGNLTISNGGTVTSNTTYLSRQNFSTSTALVTGANSMWNLGTNSLYVGNVGNGTLTISSGGTVLSGTSYLDGSVTSTGTAVVTGANSTWNLGSGTLYVGNSGTGILTISNGGTVFSGTGYLDNPVGSNGTVVVTGANSTWNLGTGTLYVGNAGNGTLTISNGGAVLSGTSYLDQVATSNGTAVVDGANSIWNLGSGTLNVGNTGTGTLTISNAGTVALGVLDLAVNSGSNGTVNLNSNGVLEVGGSNGILAGSGTATFNLGGGVIQVTGSDLTTSLNATLAGSTISTINTNGMNATLSGVLGGSGNLTKIGAGSLTLSGNNSYAGDTTLDSGTLVLSGNNAAASGNVNVNNGTLLINSNTALSAAGLNINGGTIDNTSGSLVTVTTGTPVNLSADLIFTGSNDLNLGTGAVLISNLNNGGSDVNITVLNGNLIFGGQVYDEGDSNDLNKLGAGSLVLTNNSPAYGGSTNVEQGSLVLAGNESIADTDINLGDGNGNSGTLVLGNATSGPVTQTIQGIAINSNSGTTNAIVGGNATNSLLRVFVPAGTPTEYDGYLGAGAGNTSNVPANALTLEVRTGSGSNLYLTANNTYLGGTNLDFGTLQISQAASLGADTGTAATELLLGNGTGSTAILEAVDSISTNRWIVLNSSSAGSSIDVDSGDTLVLGANSALLNGGNAAFALNKSGAGLLQLAGTTANYTYSNSTYAAATNVQGGTLQLGANNLVPRTSTVTISTGATFDLNGFDDHIANLAGAGNVTLGSSFLATGYGNVSATFSGVVSGTGNLSKFGTAAFTLGGLNTFTGNMNVNFGTLVVGSSLTLQDSTVNDNAGLSFNSSISSATFGALAGTSDFALENTSSGALALTVGNNGSDATYSGNLSGPGRLIKIGAGTQTLVGNVSYVGNTTISGGTLLYTGSLAGYTGSIVDNADLAFEQSFADTYSGNISGTGNITQSGSSILTLNGHNSYTGNTTVDGGTLILDGTTAGSITSTDALQLGISSGNTGTMTIQNGGSLTANTGDLGVVNGSFGYLTVDDSTALFNGSLTVGDSGTGYLTIQNGGIVTSGTGLLGSGFGANGTVLVTGAGSTWNLGTNGLYVGNASVGSLTISNGGSVISGLSYVGFHSGASGTVLVTDANSIWNLGSNQLLVGANGNISGGATGNLTIANGGSIISGEVHLGLEANASGTALVTGANSTWNLGADEFFVGGSGLGNLTIANGGNVSGHNSILGYESGSSGTVLVTDANSIWSMASLFTVGFSGLGNLTIANGGSVISGESYVGRESGSDGMVLVTDANSIWNTQANPLNVGYNGTGSLTIANGGYVSSGTGYMGYASGSSGSVLVDGANSTWSLPANGLYVGYDGLGNLTISNGGNVATGTARIGFESDSSGTVLVTGANSTLSLPINGLYVGYNGTGNLTIANGGTVVSGGGGGRIGYGNGSVGTVLVTDLDSTWNFGTADLYVGYSGAGSLTIANGAYVNSDFSDNNGIAVYLGYNANSTGNLTVTDVNPGSSQLTVANGALVVGYNGAGNAIIANGGQVSALSSDTNSVGVYLGYNAGSTGNLTVTDVEPNSGDQSELYAKNALVVGGNGTGSLTIANGGYVNAAGFDGNGVGLYLASGVGSIGNLTITDVEPISGDASQLSVSNGATAVGYSGTGSLLITNGGYANLSGNDGQGSPNVNLYIGYVEGAIGNVTVTGVEPNSGDQSELYSSNGAIVAGFEGLGSLTVANGGYIESTGADGSNIGLYIGENPSAAGSSVLVTDYNTLGGIPSEFDVTGGAVQVGYFGNGSLSVANGGYFNSTGNDGTGVSMYIGNVNGVTGTVSVDGSAAGNASNLTVSGGAVVAGVDGSGVITVTNGGYLNVSGSNGNIGLYLGLNSDGGGSLSVDGNSSEADITGGALAVGYYGAGNLSITNGGLVMGGSENYEGLGVVIGWHGTSSGNATVSDAGSELYLDSGALVVGNWGPGNLTVANAGNVTANGYDDNMGVGLYIGRGNNGVGNLTVEDILVDLAIFCNPTLTQSSLTVGDGSLAVGYDDAGTLTIQNGGLVSANGTDNNGFGAVIGYNSGSTGTVAVSDALIPSSHFKDVSSEFDVTSGALVVGYNGNGTLTVANGGLVDASGSTSGVSAYLGYNTDGINTFSTTTVTGVEPNSGLSSEFNVSNGALVVAYNGAGSLSVENGGLVSLSGTDGNNNSLYVGDNSGSTGNVIVDGVNIGSSTNTTSELDVNGGALAVGYEGNGTLSVTNGGQVNANGSNDWSRGLLVGFSNSATGSVTVDGMDATSGLDSQLSVSNGSAVFGYHGTGCLTVSNGGNVSASGSDDNGIALYLGYHGDSTGVANITGSDANGNLSTLSVSNGALAVGYYGTGNLNITNGGSVYAGGENSRDVSLYVGRESNGVGNVLIDGMGSNMDVEDGTAVIGSYGAGYLTLSNGGSLTTNGTDGNGVTAYLGYHGDSLGSANISGTYGNTSTWTITNGSLVLGDHGEGDVTVGFAGSLQSYGDNNGYGLVMGDHGSGNGTLTVDGQYAIASFDNTAIIGNWGNGTLNIEGSGDINLSGNDSNNVTAYLGYQKYGTGTLNIVGIGVGGEPGINDSGININGGALVVGYQGTGNLTVSNGGNLSALGTDGNVAVYFGDRRHSSGTGLVTDANTTFLANNGSVVVGNAGSGSLTIANGAVATLSGFDINNASLVLGNDHSGRGNVTVDGANSTLFVGDGPQTGAGLLVIGNYGSGTLTVSNGGNVTQNGSDGLGNFSVVLGQNWCSYGTLAIDGSANGTASSFNVTDFWDAIAVGENGTGSITITNGGALTSNGADQTFYEGMYLGVNAGATGTVTVDGSGGPSSLTLWNGGLAVGFSGNGTLNITNGGLVSVQAPDINGFGVTLGYNTGSNGNVTVDGNGSVLDIEIPGSNTTTPGLGTSAGLLVIGENGTGSLNISNGGLVTALDGLRLGDQTGSSGNLNILNGGTLEAGRIFTSGSGNYNVYMADGTIRVVGSDLLATVDIWTGHATDNYIDTNGFNATFSGNISGDDELVKLGLGTLTLNGTDTYAGTAVDAGTLVVDNGNLYHPGNDLIVADQAHSTANFTIQDGGLATVDDLLVGTHYKSNGAVVVDGNASALSISDTATIGGYRSQASLTIQNGGNVTVFNDDDSQVALAVDANGRHSYADLTVTGADGGNNSSQLTIENGGALVIGENGHGFLTVANGGLVTAAGEDSNGIGLYLGENEHSFGKASVVGGSAAVQTELSVANGGLAIGYSGVGILDVTNGGLVDQSGGGNIVLGDNSGSYGKLNVGDVQSGTGNQSTLYSSQGALIVGLDGTGNVTIENGGLVSLTSTGGSGFSLYFGYNSTGIGNLTVSGIEPLSGCQSELSTSNSGAVAVGYNGTGTLSVENGGLVSLAGADSSNNTLYIGDNSGSTGTVIVDGVNDGAQANISSELDVNGGALMVGYDGNGTLNVTNGGLVNVNGSNDWSRGLLVGYSFCSIGCVTVDGSDATSGLDSQFNVSNGSAVFGYQGTGYVTVSNGGNLAVTSSDNHGIAVYLGYQSSATGIANITGYDGNGNSSELYVSSGALAIGYQGSGALNASNGSYVDVFGLGDDGISLYLGDQRNSSGNLSVDDSIVNVANGALAVGYRGAGNLSITNGGNLSTSGLDKNDITAYLGDHGSATGTATVDNAEWDVENGALAVGYHGTGTLTIQNGGEVDAGGMDENGIAAYLGYHGSSTGTVTVDNSEWEVDNGALVVGYYGTGNLTIQNGGYLDTDGADSNNVTAYIGYHGSSNSSVTVTGAYLGQDEPEYASEWEIDNGSLVVGYNGAGLLSIQNGGNVSVFGADENGSAILLGANACTSIGAITVDGNGSVLNVGEPESLLLLEPILRGGGLEVGFNGTGSLSITNGGAVNLYGADDNGNAMTVGYNANAIGNVSVDGNESVLSIGFNFHPSEHSPFYYPVGGALDIGYNGAGSLSITNGGTVNVLGSNFDGGPAPIDETAGLSVILGNNAGASGSLTVSGWGSVLNIGQFEVETVEPGIVPDASLPLHTGGLVVGNNGNGTLTINHHGTVNVYGMDENGNAVTLGYGSGANGNVTVDGWLSSLNVSGTEVLLPTIAPTIDASGGFQKQSPSIPGGAFVVGYDGSGTLTITNGAFVNASGGLVLAENSSLSTGNVTISHGGVLAVGGENGLAAGNGAYSFSMAGGTLSVIDHDLTSSLNITTSSDNLTDSFNTNGWNATLSGVISGNDNIQKIGEGNLTLAAAETYTGATLVRAGTLVFDGSLGGSLSPSSGNLIVGDHRGDNGGLLIDNGANFTTSNLVIGNHGHSSGNVTVDDSTLDVSNLTVGNYGEGSLTVTNGGTVVGTGIDSFGYGLDIGVQTWGNGSVTITDGATLTASTDIAVGLSGPGSLTIANGGILSDGGNLAVGVNAGSQGAVTVTDPNTVLGMDNGVIYVGDYGPGSLTIANGAALDSNATTFGIAAYVGYGNTSNGTVTVDGANSTWSLSGGELVVGAYGNGALTISNGGAVNASDGFNSDFALLIGDRASGTGNVTVEGRHSTLTIGNVSSGTGAAVVGGIGTGYLTVSNGGKVNLDGNVSEGGSLVGESLVVGDNSGSNGTVSVTGWHSALNAVGGVVVGNDGTGSLTVSNGGRVSLGADENGDALSIGESAGGSGTLTLSGWGADLDANGNVDVTNGTMDIEGGHLGIVNGGLYVADGTSNITVTQTGGQVYVGGPLEVGPSANVTGTYDLSGGKLIAGGFTFLGINGGTGVFTQTGGKFIDAASRNVYVGYNGSTGVLNVNGGLFDSKNAQIFVTNDGASTGTVNLNGGTLATFGLLNEGESNGSLAAINFNGGVLRANGDNADFVSNFDDGEAVVRSGGAFIDSNGYNVTINTDLAGIGALTKLGNGTLTLTGTDTYKGTNVSGGTLIMDGGDSGEIVHSSANTTVGVNSGDNASLLIQNGGAILDNFGYIANALSSTGTVLVTGQGSFWHSAGDLDVGVLGAGSLSIANGGLVSNDNGTISELSGGTGSSSVSVDGAGSQWKNGGLLTVAENYNGTLTITNGGLVSSSAGDVATNSGVNGTVTVDGEGSEWIINTTLLVGDAGNGSLTISNGGEVSQKTGGGGAIIGNATGSTGAVLVTDTDVNGDPSTWSVGGNLTVGQDGTASLTIVNGALVKADLVQLAENGDATATLELDSQGELSADQLVLGAGNLAGFTFNGGILQARESTTDFISNISAVTLGDLGGTIDSQGFNVTVNSLLNGAGNLTKAGTGNLTLSAPNTFTGQTFINAGTLILTDPLALQNSTLNYLLGGGKINFSNLTSATLGGLSGDRDLDLSNAVGGALDLSVGNNNDDTTYSGNLTDTGNLGGNLTKIGWGTLTLTGTSTFAGGTTVEKGFINFDSNASLGTGNIYLAGGGLQWAQNTSTDVSNRLFLNEGRDSLDTNGNDVSFSNGLTGNGSLVKTGAGDLALGGNNVYTGDTYLDEGTLTVGGNTTLTGSPKIFVGSGGKDPTLAVVNGGYVDADFLDVGQHHFGLVLVNGTNSSLLTTALVVGGGAYGKLVISNSGNVSSGYAAVGQHSNATVVVTGANSTWTDSGKLDVGQHGNDGTVLVKNDATADFSGLVVLGDHGNSTGILDISCNATASIGELELANGYCSNASVSINSGGLLDITNGTLSAGNGTYCFMIGNGTLEVSGVDLATSVNFTLKSGDTAIVDTNGVNATFAGVVSGGGLLQKTDNGTLSLTNNNTYSGGTNVLGGTLAVDGGSINHAGADLYVNAANFTVQSGGSATVNNATFDGGNATGLVTDAGSTLAAQVLTVGSIGAASLTIANGGLANITGGDNSSVGAYIGDNATGLAEVTGTGSKLRVENTLVIGDSALGNLTVDSGGTVSSHGTILGDSANGTGNLLITDSGSHYDAYTNAMFVGNSGMGSLTIANGGDLTSFGADGSNISMYVGAGENSNGTVDVSGGYLQLRNGSLVVGNEGAGTLTVEDGGYVSIANGNTLDLAVNSSSEATVNLNAGGTLSVGGANGIQAGAGSYAFNFDGGTLRVHSADLSTSVNLALGDNTTSTINTNGYNATINGTVSGNGSLNKSGNGTLALNANNTYTGATNVTTGNLVVNGQSASSVNVLNAGAILGGNGTIGGNVALTNGGVVSPGIANSVSAGAASGLATLTVTGNVAWNVTASTIPWHLGSTNNAADLLNVLGSVTNTGSPTATLLFDFQGTGFFDGNLADSTYTLITSSSDLADGGLSLSQFDATNVLANNQGEAYGQSYFMWANSGTALDFVVVPEPSTWGLLAGGAMLALAGLRRKRNVKA
jgi:fibronectin-binding autotransporter adhesin